MSSAQRSPSRFPFPNACVRCNESDYVEGEIGDRTFLVCSSCRWTGMHLNCHDQWETNKKGKDLVQTKEEWFCSEACEKVYKGVDALIGARLPCKNSQVEMEIVKYRGTRGRKATVDGALRVFKTAFDVKRLAEGKTCIEMMCCGFRSEEGAAEQLDFSDFLLIVARKKGMVIAAATFRVTGAHFIEMPYIATAGKHRRAGHASLIISTLTEHLAQLGVRYLVVPAVEKTMAFWKEKIGMEEVTQEEEADLKKWEFYSCGDSTSIMVTAVQKSINMEGQEPSLTGGGMVDEKENYVNNAEKARDTETNTCVQGVADPDCKRSSLGDVPLDSGQEDFDRLPYIPDGNGEEVKTARRRRARRRRVSVPQPMIELPKKAFFKGNEIDLSRQGSTNSVSHGSPCEMDLIGGICTSQSILEDVGNSELAVGDATVGMEVSGQQEGIAPEYSTGEKPLSEHRHHDQYLEQTSDVVDKEDDLENLDDETGLVLASSSGPEPDSCGVQKTVKQRGLNKRYKKIRVPVEERVCYGCGRQNTTSWYRGPVEDSCICRACYGQERKGQKPNGPVRKHGMSKGTIPAPTSISHKRPRLDVQTEDALALAIADSVKKFCTDVETEDSKAEIERLREQNKELRESLLNMTRAHCMSQQTVLAETRHRIYGVGNTTLTSGDIDFGHYEWEGWISKDHQASNMFHSSANPHTVMKERTTDDVPRTTGVLENSFKGAILELQKGLDALKDLHNIPRSTHTGAGEVKTSTHRTALPVESRHIVYRTSVQSVEATQTQEDVFDIPSASFQVQDTTQTKANHKISTLNQELHLTPPRGARPMKKSDPQSECCPVMQEGGYRTSLGKTSGRLGPGSRGLLSPPLLMDTAGEYGTQNSVGANVDGTKTYPDSDGSQKVNELMSQSPIAERMRVLSQLVETRIERTKNARHSQTTTVTIKDHQIDDALRGINQFEWPDG